MTILTRILTALLASVCVCSALGQVARPPAPTEKRVEVEQLPPGEGKTNAPYKIPENKIITFAVPLSKVSRQAVAISHNPVVDFAMAAVAVPRGFDPEIPTPILLINGSSDGPGSSIRVVPGFTNVALRLGWMVIAADGPAGKPPEDNTPWRWAMVSSLLDHINKVWPASKRWPMATAGVSGGGKWAGVMGAILAHKGYNLIGVFMSGVNQDMASEAAKIYDPAIRFKAVPIFLSSGSDDKIATPEHHEEVKASLLNNGFRTVRLETFKGGHALSELDLRKALSWFVEIYGKGGVDEPDPKEP